mgnify:CR=1 FL=1
MIYYLQGSSLEQITTDISKNLRYQNMQDTRNYAITFVYPDGNIDQVLRTPNLRYHYTAIKDLYNKSTNLSKFINKKDTDELDHFDLDTKLVKNDVLVLYYAPSNYDLDNEYGAMYLPENPNDFQKKFIKEKLVFLKSYPNFVLGIYNSTLEKIDSIAEFDLESAMDYLEKFVNELKLN